MGIIGGPRWAGSAGPDYFFQTRLIFTRNYEGEGTLNEEISSVLGSCRAEIVLQNTISVASVTLDNVLSAPAQSTEPITYLSPWQGVDIEATIYSFSFGPTAAATSVNSLIRIEISGDGEIAFRGIPSTDGSNSVTSVGVGGTGDALLWQREQTSVVKSIAGSQSLGQLLALGEGAIGAFVDISDTAWPLWAFENRALPPGMANTGAI